MGIEVLEPRLQPALTHPGSILLSATEGATTPPVSVATFQDTTPALPLPVGIHDPRFAAPNVCTGSYYSFAYNPPGAAWSFNFSPGRYGSGVAGNGSGFTSGNPDAPEGTQAGFLQGAGSSISQTLDLAAGSYAVRFQAAQRGNWQPAGPQSFQVALDGTVLGTFTPGDTRYAGFATDQVGVTAGSHTLTFTGRTGGDSTAFLDQVRLTPAGSGDAGYTATVDWGDGNTSSGTVIYDAGSDTFSVVAGHAYAEEGSYPVTTTVTHGTDTLTVNSTAAVADAPLSAAAAALTADAGGNVSGPVAYFTDANPNSTASDYTATVDWGDGTQTAGTVNVVSPIAGGSFEAPDVGTGTFSAFAYDPTGSAWSFSGSAGLAGDGSGFTSGNPSAPDGTQVAFVQQAGSFSQDVVLPAGTYTLGFRAAQRGNWNQGGQTFQVQVDGTAVGTFTPAGSAYTSFTTDAFTVAAGTHTVRFVGLNPLGGDNTAFIDQVALGQTVYAVTGSHAYAQSGTYTVGVAARDVGGSTTTASGTATVPDFALTLTSPGDQASGEGDAVLLPVYARGGAHVADSYSATGLPDGLFMDEKLGVVTGSLFVGSAGTYHPTVSVSDGTTTVRQAFTWTVTPAPLALDAPGNQSSNEGDPVTQLTVAARGGTTGAYTYTATGLPAGVALDPVYGLFYGTVAYGAAATNGGVYDVTVTAEDGAASVSQSFTWTVGAVPLALADPGDQSNYGQDRVYLPLQASGGASATYTYTASNLPDGLSLNADTGEISGVLTAAAATTSGGAYAVAVTASDGTSTVTRTFTWTVTNTALTFTAPDDQTSGEGDAVDLGLDISGGLSSPYTYTVSGLPNGLSLDAPANAITGTVGYGAADTNGGAYTVTITASDGTATVSQTFHWTVANVPLALTNLGDQFSSEGEEVNSALTAGGGEGATYTFSAAGLPAGLSIDAARGTIAGVIDYSAAETNGGVYAVTITVSDGVSSTSGTFTWTVDDAPVPRPTGGPWIVGAAVPLAPDGGGHFAGTVATFTSGNPSAAAGDFTATIAWGDGTTSAGTVTLSGGTFSVTGSHSYAAGWPGTATVTIVDTAFDVQTTVGSGTPVLVERRQEFLATNATGSYDGMDLTLIGIDPEGDTLTPVITVQPAHGTLTYNRLTGLYDYHAASGYLGQDYFCYHLTDGQATSPVVRVNILVDDGTPNALSTTEPWAVGAPFDPAGPDYSTVNQRPLDDCWLAAAAAALANERPRDLEKRVQVQGNGWLAVKFADELFSYKILTPTGDGKDWGSSNGTPPWLASLAKAYAHRLDRTHDPIPNMDLDHAYNLMNQTRAPMVGVAALTGPKYTNVAFKLTELGDVKDKLVSALKNSKVIVANTESPRDRPDLEARGIQAGHAYAVIGYNPNANGGQGGGWVELYSPNRENPEVNNFGVWRTFYRGKEDGLQNVGRFFLSLQNFYDYFNGITVED